MLTPTEINPAPAPRELCGYPIERILTGDQSYLAQGPGGRKVVLKRVDEDCLLHNKLHPSIKERLARVRELAHAGVANLHGVERDADVDAAWLVWEYVDGQTFDEFLADPARTPHEVMLVARELIAAVDALHAQGIVHGSLIGSNVIITRDGGVRLTHVSPLLYTEMDVDVDCVLSLLEDAVESREGAESSFGQLVLEARRERTPLRAFGTRLGALLEARAEPGKPQGAGQERHLRRRTLLAAALIALLGLLLAYVIFRAINS